MYRKPTLLILPLFILTCFGCQRQSADSDSARPVASKTDVAANPPADATDPQLDDATSSENKTNVQDDPPAVIPVSANLPTTADELKAVRANHDRQVWSEEVQAQKHEETFVELWDNLIHKTNKYEVLKHFSFNNFVVGTKPVSETLDWQIQKTRFDEPSQTIPFDQWPAWVAGFEEAGYEIVETEFHHSSFDPSEDGATSKVSFLIHVTHGEQNRRFIVRGNLRITWQAKPDATTGRFIPDTIDASDIVLMSREGDPAFRETRVDRFPTDTSGEKYPTTIHPVIIQDLNNDGLPEIIVSGYNHVYFNKGNWKFEFGRLCQRPVPHVNAAAFADFDGDGFRDYMAATKNGLPFLYKGTERGTFPTKPRPMDVLSERLRVPVNVVPGDIDGDGDMDVFIGQQKPGYFNGDIPTPYYDAKDSFPSYLLENDGRGNFTDVTADSGLGDKILRRNFAASLIDYDQDGDLDFIMTSDFSGTDVFTNDGHGKFTDVSDTLEPKAYAFGMSHTFGDYNLDGMIDFLTVGMSSTTARRLEQLGLGREEFPDYNDARMKMGYGNRMYVYLDGRFVQAPFNQDVARTGWSWGSTTLDFDNDADPDVYVVNGQTSGSTTKDYCTSFWCHDVYYKRGQRPDGAIRELFGEMAPLFNGSGISWNGYEHNALLMNVEGRGFVNVAFLMNVAFEFDSRAAVSGDLDGDGRVDLIVEHKDHRASESKLHMIRNIWDQGGHWVGVHLRQAAGGASPIGARVNAKLADGRILVQHNVAGHSVWAQHANTVHFGLGDEDVIALIDVRWPDGSSSTITEPAVDNYHIVTSGN